MSSGPVERAGAGDDILSYYARYYRDDVIDLSSSSPTPASLAGTSHLETLDYVPPTGGEELRTRISRLYETISPDDILLASGASEVLVALAHALVRRGDTVEVDRGTYPSFTAALHRIGARAEPRWHREDGALVALCNPSVPDGRLRRHLPAASTERPVVVDECHIDIVHAGQRPVRAADQSPFHVSVSGLSKNLGFAGLRIGWLATRNADVRRRVDREIQLLSGGPSSLGVLAATQALDQYQTRVASVRSQAAKNVARVFELLDELGWRYRPPDAGLTLEAWPPVCVPPESESRLREMGYFLVPCSLYGRVGAYRISVLAPVPHLRPALEELTCA